MSSAMYRYLLIIPILLLATLNSQAQVTLMGVVYELNTHISLQSIRVTNLTTKQFTVSDSVGIFYISAKPGDLLAFRGYGYKSDTVSIINKNHLEIYLEHETTMLKDVNITSNTTKLGILKPADLHGQTVIYQQDKDGNLQGGLTLRFGYGKDKKALHSKQLSDEEATDEEIDKAFTTQNISKTIPLRGQALKDFAVMYRPDRKTFKAEAFNMTVYINDSYKKYMALPPDKRKPVPILQDTAARQ